MLPKNEITSYIKTVSKLIVDNIGGTEFGPAASFRDIARAAANNTQEILSVSTPLKFVEIAEPTFVGMPIQLGFAIGAPKCDSLSKSEQEAISEAAEAIYQTYITAIENIE